MKKKMLISVAMLLISAVSMFSVAEAHTEALGDTTVTAIEEDTLDYADSIAADNSGVDSVSSDSSLVKFRNAAYDMLCLVAHCEGVKTEAYFDPIGKKWTIAFGNTVRPDGKAVRYGDCIRSEAELMHYFNAHIEQYMYDDMCRYLHLDKMNNAEIVAMGSFLYNCGSGVLRQKNGAPSQLAKAANAYFDSHSEKTKAALKSLIEQKVTSKGKVLPQLQKRRDLELRILFGEIVLDNKGELKLANAVNFAEVALGGVYCFGGRRLPVDTLDLCNRLGNMGGRNLNDSIQNQLRGHIRPMRRKR